MGRQGIKLQARQHLIENAVHIGGVHGRLVHQQLIKHCAKKHIKREGEVRVRAQVAHRLCGFKLAPGFLAPCADEMAAKRFRDLAVLMGGRQHAGHIAPRGVGEGF